MNNEEKILTTLDTLTSTVGTLVSAVNQINIRQDKTEALLEQISSRQDKTESLLETVNPLNSSFPRRKAVG